MRSRPGRAALLAAVAAAALLASALGPGPSPTAAGAVFASVPAGAAVPGPSGPGLPPGPGPAAPPPGGEEHELAGGGRVVALSFDDGPDPRWTPQVLALLARFRVRATFCLIGRQVLAHPTLVARIVAAGHRVCNHTFDHDEHLARRPGPVIDQDIQAATAAIERAAPGTPLTWFRAPGGTFTPALDRMLPPLRLRPLGWSVDPDDWRRPGPAVIVARVQAHVRPGSIILLHDGGGDRAQTVAALQQLLPALAARGYTFVQP